MKLAAVLLVLVGVTHFGYEPLAMTYAQHAAAARAWFYVLRGVEGLCLFAIIASLVRSRAVMAVCCLGIFEESLTAACRVSKPIGEVPGYTPFEGLCGSGWYSAGLIALGVVALGIAYDLGRGRGKTRT